MAPEPTQRGLLFLAATAVAPSCLPLSYPAVEVAFQLVAIMLLALALFAGGRVPMIRLPALAILLIVEAVVDGVAIFEVGVLSPRTALLLILTLLTLVFTIVALAVAALPGSISPWPLALPGVVGGCLLVALSHPIIDVDVFLQGAAHALEHGHDPYAMTFQSPYSTAQDRMFYGPGLVRDGVIHVGFPYPPVVLLTATLGSLLGDVRFACIVGMGLAAWLLRRSGPANSAILLVGAPASVYVLRQSWVEPISVALLALTVTSLGASRRSGPLWLGALLVSKQYFIVAVPLLVLLVPAAKRSSGLWRSTAVCVVTGAALSIPFLAWGPTGFWNSVVRFQFLQPFRSDSRSLLVVLVNHFGWPSPSVAGWLPLLAAVVAAVLAALCAPRHPPAFAAGLAFVLLVLVTLSKQAFPNYFFLIDCAAVIAALTWPPTTQERLTTDVPAVV